MLFLQLINLGQVSILRPTDDILMFLGNVLRPTDSIPNAVGDVLKAIDGVLVTLLAAAPGQIPGESKRSGALSSKFP